MYELLYESSCVKLAIDTCKSLVLRSACKDKEKFKVHTLKEFRVELNDSFIVRIECITSEIVSAYRASNSDNILISIGGSQVSYELYLPNCYKIDFINVQFLGDIKYVWVGYKRVSQK
jgi:hypothetical protein